MRQVTDRERMVILLRAQGHTWRRIGELVPHYRSESMSYGRGGAVEWVDLLHRRSRSPASACGKFTT